MLCSQSKSTKYCSHDIFEPITVRKTVKPIKRTAQTERTVKNSDKEDNAKAKETTDSKSINQILYRNRILTIIGEINQKTTKTTVEQLLALSSESDEPITLLLSSPGGHVESGDSIYDLIRFIRAPVKIVGTGWVGSIAILIFLAADKKHRYCLPNTRFLIHQPSGGILGDASDISIQADELIKIRKRINRIIAERTGKTQKQVNSDTERDYWMSATESLKYGLVGSIITSIDELS
ncbi:MAG: ATP-dependent Clp protease proteolytic subunit [Gammaproteobacteria bacterium]|nr:ATP-dependent Clp protease proteolytic subunit [Gammaproteobacteria bacterium]MYK42771.1 ATP-dependent Clp protease proteolytic subunit [Gammaproteobacteria bacterium]